MSTETKRTRPLTISEVDALPHPPRVILWENRADFVIPKDIRQHVTRAYRVMIPHDIQATADAEEYAAFWEKKWRRMDRTQAATPVLPIESRMPAYVCLDDVFTPRGDAPTAGQPDAIKWWTERLTPVVEFVEKLLDIGTRHVFLDHSHRFTKEFGRRSDEAMELFDVAFYSRLRIRGVDQIIDGAAHARTTPVSHYGDERFDVRIMPTLVWYRDASDGRVNFSTVPEDSTFWMMAPGEDRKITDGGGVSQDLPPSFYWQGSNDERRKTTWPESLCRLWQLVERNVGLVVVWYTPDRFENNHHALWSMIRSVMMPLQFGVTPEPPREPLTSKPGPIRPGTATVDTEPPEAPPIRTVPTTTPREPKPTGSQRFRSDQFPRDTAPVVSDTDGSNDR